ncbi:transcriptional regulator, luxR family [Spongiibacter sp. IMCC21906]|uniref:response regulator transcription factor n=1 Tax=Spongiibacter sp. IMCC21906 TaxID=1620392 RepID=UPI00062DCFBC|nr:LuxR C-terminal-related transcriptional regulator [Spongiibacter sp. IMCC21906]AKH70831.1 transcriptional regulator, luxR family [Spongiibacter sp. IMCC21906]
MSSNLLLVIGVQILTRGRHLQVDSALNSMEAWLSYGRDFIVDQSVDVIRGSIIEPGQGSELQDALVCATKREQQVICEVLKGHSNKEIADNLSLSYYTVENHLRRIYKKFGVHSRTALIAALRP